MRCFPVGVWLWKVIDDEANWRPTNSVIPWNFKYVSLVNLPPWTFGHRQDHILRCKHSLWSAAPWMPVNWTCVLLSPKTLFIPTHTLRSNGHFSRWTFIRLPLNSPSFLNCASFWDRPKLDNSPMGLFFGRPLSNSFNLQQLLCTVALKQMHIVRLVDVERHKWAVMP